MVDFNFGGVEQFYSSQLFSIRFKFSICLLSRTRTALKLILLSTRYPCIELRTESDVIVYISYLFCFLSHVVGLHFVILMGMSGGNERRGGGEVASLLTELRQVFPHSYLK